ncbi:MAG: mannitol-1-phosphate 5-dehydrogenase [Candidatus Caldatribacteriota bacterium]
MNKDKKMVQFGAGRIGRAFLGQVFSLSGYEVIFVDINRTLVKEINRQKEYQIIVKENNVPDKKIQIKEVQAIEADDVELIIPEILEADIICTAVGKNSLDKIIPLIAEGLLWRWKKRPDSAIDIIIAENVRYVSRYMRRKLKRILPGEFPFGQLVGLVETSIGKMVPIVPEEEIKFDPLTLFTEPYNQLIVDKKAFKKPIPDLPELLPVENIQAYVDRKLFIHNFGHTATAYLGYQYQPDFKYIYEPLQKSEIYQRIKKVMLQSARALNQAYPDDLPMNDLETHIEDLLARFQNRALRDTIYRVGRDLYRKLHKNERIIGSIILAEKNTIDWEEQAKIFKAALQFRAKDEYGQLFPGDRIFMEKELPLGIEHILRKVSRLNLSNRIEAKVFQKIINYSLD